MTLPLFLGASLIAFGPLLSLLYLVVLKRSQLTIIALCSAWVFMMAFIFSSVVWAVVKPLQSVYAYVMATSVIFQTIYRFGIVKLYYYSYRKLLKVSSNSGVSSTGAQILPFSELSAAVSVGVGTAGTYCFIIYGHVGSKTLGPGTIYLETCPTMSLYILHACLCCAMSLLHIMWSILSFDAWNRKSFVRGFVILVSHSAAVFATLFNGRKDGCIYSIITEIILVVVVGGWTSLVIHRSANDQ